MKNRYKTDNKTKEEFVKFLDWIKKNQTSNNLSDEVDRYCKESDIALYNLRVLKGANTRNPKREFFWVLLMFLLSIPAGYLLLLGFNSLFG